MQVATGPKFNRANWTAYLRQSEALQPEAGLASACIW